jgi:excisionase family DNA binding protein
MNETNETLLLTSIQAAKALSISARTLWQLKKDGKLPFVRIYRSVRYDPKDITKFIENQKK